MTATRAVELLRNFRAARHGNVALIFALTLIPLMGAVGALANARVQRHLAQEW